ncbi:MAG: phosphoserine transaminase [Acidimicrobiales bacterium]
MTTVEIPKSILPSDGRFGSGPSKVRLEAVDALVAAAPHLLGTSHRRPAVKDVVANVRAGLVEMFQPPEGYEIVIGNGGSSAFWDIAIFCLIEKRSQHLCFGEFSERFFDYVARAPHLAEPRAIASELGTHPEPVADTAIDTYSLTHNETSTAVAAPVVRPRGTNGSAADGLVLVDATSAAGGMRVDLSESDAYYFAPQKCFGSDGGLFVAIVSPQAIDRAQRLKSAGRWAPAFLDFVTALENSRLSQTTNTPALATLFLLSNQIDWINANGGLEWSAARCERSSSILYEWAEKSSFATPFVSVPDERSPVVATIDFDDGVDANEIAAVLRENGIVDTESYRKLGRNQLRIATFPSIEPSDVEALTACIDWIVERL